MKPVSHNARLIRRAYWLIRLRWIAIAGAFIVIFIADNAFEVSLHSTGLYCVAAMLVVENFISLLLLKRLLKTKKVKIFTSINRIIHFQITVDLLMLTSMLHYSGGIENPFIIYFVFHMAIASILLSTLESYLLATFAVLLLVFLTLLEYKKIIPHYCLEGFATSGTHADGIYALTTIGVLASTFYLIVYMTSSISTKLRWQQDAYEQANKELQQKDRIKDEYVSRVTHDIKGHLAAIQSCLDVVANKIVGPLNEQQTEFIERAYNRTKAVTRFVKTLLELTHLRLSNKLQMQPFSLKITADNALASVKTKARNKSIELISNIESPMDNILGNQFSIEESITNLLLNAIKYTPQNGSVKLTTKNEDDHVLIEVADTGIGIPRDELPNIFDEFYRANNAKKVEKDGTGIGLTIVKQIIERHHGKICAESEEDVGTKFKLILPKTKNT